MMPGRLAVRAEGIPMSHGYSYLNKHPFLDHTLNSRRYRTIYTVRGGGRAAHWDEQMDVKREHGDWRKISATPNPGSCVRCNCRRR